MLGVPLPWNESNSYGKSWIKNKKTCERLNLDMLQTWWKVALQAHNA